LRELSFSTPANKAQLRASKYMEGATRAFENEPHLLEIDLISLFVNIESTYLAPRSLETAMFMAMIITIQ
jgi:hypothetical protein